MAFPPDRRTGLVTGEVGRDLEEPSAWLLRLVAERPDEGFLSQILGSLQVPHLAV